MMKLAHFASVLRNHRRPFRLVVARALTMSGLSSRLTIPQRGYRLRFYPSNLSELLWVDPTARERELRLVRACLQPGDHVIDVGANVGDTALTAATAVGPTGRVWAIEAHPRTYAFLLGNLTLNGVANVSPVNAAAGAAPGRLSFGDARRDDTNCIGGTGLEVEAARLDHLVPYKGRIDLLKIDVEGYELPVCHGAPDTLARTRIVLFEVAERHFRRYGYDLATMLALLEAQGFTVLRPLGERHATRIDVRFTTDAVENLIAVRDTEEFEARTGWVVDGKT
jgi:FkbM family methyltransferase